MAKLSKKQQTRLGELINELQVCSHMLDSGEYDIEHWLTNKYRVILALYEEFGVEDVNLERAQEWLERKAKRKAKAEAKAEAKAKAQAEAQAEAVAEAPRQPSDYTAIALWGEELGSYAYYIEKEQHLACAEGAPLNAIFKKDDGTWATLDQMQNLPLKAQLEAQLAELA